MSATQPYEARMTTLPAVLEAERLLDAFDSGDPKFGELFFAADRDIFGAVLAYASLAVREVAAREGADHASVRRTLRLHISRMQAHIDNQDGEAT